MWLYRWALYSVPLVYVPVFIPKLLCFGYRSIAVQREVRSVMPPALLFFLKVLRLLGFLCGYIHIVGSFALFFEKCHWNFDRDCVKSVVCFG